MSDQNTNPPEPQRVGKSLDEIAQILANNTMARMEGRTKPKPNEVSNAKPKPAAPVQSKDDAVSVNPGSVNDDGADADDLPLFDATGNVDPATEVDGQGAGDEGSEELDNALGTLPDDEDDGTFEIEDDTLIAFEDDEDNPVSLADLKKVYRADKDKLQLTEAQQQATQQALIERAKAQEDSQKARQAIEAVFSHFDRVISQPLFAAPDQSLKTTDPARYIAQVEAYQQDQQRIADTKQQLLEAFGAHAQQQETLIKNRKAHEIAVLADKLPALKDPLKRKQASQDILDAATHYGFSSDEVNNAIDHRVYQMAYDAQQYRKIMSQSTKSAETLMETAKTKVQSQTRTLRSRGTNANTRLSAKAKQLKVLKAKASKSGDPKDVADFIAAKRST